MQGRMLLLVGAILGLSTSGCLSSGREQSSRTGGPSPSFGLNYVPQQSEPAPEGVADDGKSTSRADASRTVASRTGASRKPATADLDAATGEPSGKSIKLVNWLSNREKEQAPRKPLPLSASTAVAPDDEQLEP
jgi:hypothetical protein